MGNDRNALNATGAKFVAGLGWYLHAQNMGDVAEMEFPGFLGRNSAEAAEELADLERREDARSK